jgi:archaetidylinositol phosphate synthase
LPSCEQRDVSHDTWLHRSVRASVRPLADTRIAPNHITTARLVTGLVSAGLFATGVLTFQYWAATCFLVSMLLDRADGELARVSGKSTPWGHKYDLVCDALCNAVAFIGIGIGLRDGVFGWVAIPMGCVAGAAVGTILFWVMRIETLHGSRAAEIRVVPRFDPDDAMIIVPLAAFLNWIEPLLMAASIGAPLFALWAYRYLWRNLLTGSPKTG